MATVIVWLLSLGCCVGVVRGPGVVRRLRRLCAGVLWTGLGVLLAGLLALLHAFHAFTAEAPVAQVTIHRLTPDDAELLYHPFPNGPTQTVRIRGDQWAISGGIIKWHPWLTAAGLKSYHKPMRLSGQFSALERQRAHAPTVYALDPNTDTLWECAYRFSRYLPFIDAVYGSSAYAYADPRDTYTIYVTPSGYLITHSPISSAR